MLHAESPTFCGARAGASRSDRPRATWRTRRHRGRRGLRGLRAWAVAALVLVVLSASFGGLAWTAHHSAPTSGPQNSARSAYSLGRPGVRLPTAAPERPAVPADPAAIPVGLADLGSGTRDQYSTRGFVGHVDLGSFVTSNASLGPAADLASFQLNAFLVFASGGTLVAYWTQVLLELNTSSHQATYENNVWNASSANTSVLGVGAVVGNGSISSSSEGAYYADFAAPSLPGSSKVLSYPETVSLGLNATLSPGGRPVVKFAYDDGFGMTVFDTVSFRTAPLLPPFAGFSVDASLSGPNCPRCFGDAELVAGGPYGGFQTALTGPADVLLSLERWTGHNYAAVPQAVDYGVATAETLTGAAVVAAVWPGGAPAARIVPGGIGLTTLWSPGSTAGVWVTVATPSASGNLTFNGTAVPFEGGAVGIVLVPGTYTLFVDSGGLSYGPGAVSLAGGALATLEVGGYPVLFVPSGLPALQAWSVTLGNTTLNGTGTITFGVGNGTYNFSVGSVEGYTAGDASGNLTITGSGVTVTIPWQANSPTVLSEIVGIFDLPVGPVPLYVVVAGIAAAAVAAGLLSRPRRRRRAPVPVAGEPTAPAPPNPSESGTEPTLDDLFPEQ